MRRSSSLVLLNRDINACEAEDFVIQCIGNGLTATSGHGRPCGLLKPQHQPHDYLFPLECRLVGRPVLGFFRSFLILKISQITPL